jgi:hypothetical protein
MENIITQVNKEHHMRRWMRETDALGNKKVTSHKVYTR